MKLIRKKDYGHAVPHFNSMGGCQCHCPKCLGSIKLYQLLDGGWYASRKCRCNQCTEHCSSFDGRLVLSVEKSGKDLIITAEDPGCI